MARGWPKHSESLGLPDLPPPFCALLWRSAAKVLASMLECAGTDSPDALVVVSLESSCGWVPGVVLKFWTRVLSCITAL